MTLNIWCVNLITWNMYFNNFSTVILYQLMEILYTLLSTINTQV